MIGWPGDPLAAAAARALGPAFRAEVAVVLGSGLGEVAGPLERSVPFARVPGLSSCGVPGHAGRVGIARVAQTPVVVFQGRRHLYEGISPGQAAFPIRLARRLGAGLVVLFAAAGSVDPGLDPGTWMFVTDHVNNMGRNPLEGVRFPDRTPAFVDLTGVYRTDLWPALARTPGIPTARGVYAAFAGPTYETPAEVRWARSQGARAVGMSVVPEAVWARFLGLDVVAWARVANPAAGVSEAPVKHGDVLAQVGRNAAEGRALLEATVRAWKGEPPSAATRPSNGEG